MAELVPAPFPHLLRRMLREWERERPSTTPPRQVSGQNARVFSLRNAALIQ